MTSLPWKDQTAVGITTLVITLENPDEIKIIQILGREEIPGLVLEDRKRAGQILDVEERAGQSQEGELGVEQTRGEEQEAGQTQGGEGRGVGQILGVVMGVMGIGGALDC